MLNLNTKLEQTYFNFLFVSSTFVCPTEIIAFSDRADEFKAIDTEIIGVSCDSHFSHLAWINTPRKVIILVINVKIIVMVNLCFFSTYKD